MIMRRGIKTANKSTRYYGSIFTVYQIQRSTNWDIQDKINFIITSNEFGTVWEVNIYLRKFSAEVDGVHIRKLSVAA